MSEKHCIWLDVYRSTWNVSIYSDLGTSTAGIRGLHGKDKWPHISGEWLYTYQNKVFPARDNVVLEDYSESKLNLNNP